MKKAIKNPILTFILGLIIASGITVLASTILARDISYKNTNVEDALDDLYAKANEPTAMELLWTNPNPLSSFDIQTINVDLSNYKYVVVNATYGGNGLIEDYSTVNKSIIEVGTTGNITGVYHSADGGASTIRKAVVSETGISFGIGKFWDGSNNSSANYAVPLYIWGIK